MLLIGEKKYKMLYELTYKKLNSSVQYLKFKKHSKLIDFIDENCIGRNKTVVWLLSKERLSDIFISESHCTIQELLHRMLVWRTTGHYSLFEHKNYKSAYKMAKNMVQDNDACHLS